jgi:hypothetical protein
MQPERLCHLLEIIGDRGTGVKKVLFIYFLFD